MAEVTVGGNDYPSFADLEEADTYLGGDVSRAVAWALQGEDARGRGLVSATRQLLAMPWCEAAPDVDDAPEIVVEVAIMLAADLLANPKLFADASGSSNIKTAKAGSAQVEFFAPVLGGPPLPRALWDRLANAGLVCIADTSLNAGPYVSGIVDCHRPWRGRYADDLIADDANGLM